MRNTERGRGRMTKGGRSKFVGTISKEDGDDGDSKELKKRGRAAKGGSNLVHKKAEKISLFSLVGGSNWGSSNVSGADP